MLVIRNKKHGDETFNSTTRYDWYVLQKCNITSSTFIMFEDDTTASIKLNDDLPFIPNFGMSIFQKIWKQAYKPIKTESDSYCHTARSFVSKVKTPQHPYVLINSISKSFGKTFAYSSQPHPSQNNKKVIFSNGEYIVPIYDEGKYGITQGGIFVKVKSRKEGENLVKYLQSKLVQYLVKATKWSNFETNKQLFWYIPSPENITTIADTEIYNYFAISTKEKKEIDNKLKL